MKLIVYMPAYNEEENIKQVIANIPKRVPGVDIIEILVIDDGSKDQTAMVAASCGASVVSHNRNRGVGAAFHSAVRFALEQDADILVGIDADGQFDPLEIPNFIEPIFVKQADMVIGNRFAATIPEYMPKEKYWGNQKIAELISYVSGQTFRDVSCGFRAYNREALFRLNIFAEFTYTHETILSLVFQGLKVIEYPIHVRYDPGRKSRVAGSLFLYAIQTSKIIIRVLLDYRPLRVFGGFSALCMLIGILFEIFLLGHYIIFHSFSPYKTTGFIGLGFIIFGMLVFLIALVADMLNRIRINQDKLLYEMKKIRFKN